MRTLLHGPMPLTDAHLPLEELANLHDALGHPVRVTVLRVLRVKVRMPLAELRVAVAAQQGELDTRNLQFHVGKMQRAGIVDVQREGGRDVVQLARDVALRVKLAPPP